MPIVTIQSPSGQSFQIEVPDGASDDQILRFAKSQGLFDQAPQSDTEDLPTEANLLAEQQRAAAQQQPDPTLGEMATGGLEALATLATGVTGGAIGGFGGGVAGLAGELTGQIPQGEGQQLLQQGASALTYEPRTKFGKELVGEISEVLGVLPPFIGGAPTAAAQAGTLPTFKALQTAGKAKRGSQRVLQNASKTRRAIADEIKAGNINTENIVKTLDADGTLIDNPNLKRAVDLMGGEDAAKNTAVNFSYMNNATKQQVNKMLDTIESNKKSGRPEQIMTNRPANIIGESIASRVNALDRIKKNASKQIGDLINGDLGEKRANVNNARNDFVEALNNADVGVGLNDAGKLVADTSRTLTNINEVVSLDKLNNILGRLQSGRISAKEAHRLKRNLREMVSYDPSKVGSVKVSAEIENAFKNLSNELGESIGRLDKRYQTANRKFADSIDALSQVDRQLGNQLMIGDDLAVSKLGALSKRIGSNLQSRDNVINMIESLDDSLGKRDIKFKDNIYQQVAALADLEKIFKVEGEQSPFGFQSRVMQGVADAATGGQATPTQQLLDATINKFRSMSEMDFNDKMKALRKLAEVK